MTSSLLRQLSGSIHPLEFLHPPSEADLRSVEIALRVDGDVVHPLELPSLAAVAAECAEHLAGLAQQRRDLPIRAICGEDIALLRAFREHEIPDRSVRQRFRRDLELLHERAV